MMIKGKSASNTKAAILTTIEGCDGSIEGSSASSSVGKKIKHNIQMRFSIRFPYE